MNCSNNNLIILFNISLFNKHKMTPLIWNFFFKKYTLAKWNDFVKIVDVLCIVGTYFSAQAQNVWDLGPVNPVQ